MQVIPGDFINDAVLYDNNSGQIPVTPSGGIEIWSLRRGQYQGTTVDGRTVIMDGNGNVLDIE